MKKAKILVADDIEINRGVLGQMLEEYEIFEASNGEEAIQIIEEKKNVLDLILLDVIMPVKDGFGVLEYMNEQNLIKNIPVMLITGEGIEDISKRADELGVEDIISKPFDLYIVQKRVKNMLVLYKYKRQYGAE